MARLLQDFRYAARMLRKTPGFTLVAVFVTALGIGANTAIFSVVNAVLLRPLPYPHPEQLVRLVTLDQKRGGIDPQQSYQNFADLRAQNHSFESLAAYSDSGDILTGAGAPERVFSLEASADLFKVLGVSAQLGRTFAPEDEQPGSSVVIISDDMWQRRFGSDSHIVGRQITLGGKPESIIGVLPANFQFPFVNRQPEYFTPYNPQGGMEKQRPAYYLQVIGRLKEGVSIQQAEAEMRSIFAPLEQQYPDANGGMTISLASAHEDLVGDMRRTLLILLGAVGFVLLVACANVANLQLARASRRGREMAIRTALGAGRWRVIRQLLTEGLVLSVLGGALGLLLAVWGVSLIMGFVPADIPRVRESGLDPAVLAFTLVACVLTGVVFGLAPALHASKVDLNESLKEGGRTSTEGRSRHRVRSLLIVSEVALSLMLLVGAGLLIKSFIKLRNTSPGFNSRGVLTAQITLPTARYAKYEEQASFYQQAVESASRIPGVESVGAIFPLPYSENGITTNFTIEGRPELSPGAQPLGSGRIITPGYVRAMGIPLLEGRTFDERDTADSPKVILINETLARKYFPGEDPIGKRLHLGLSGLNGEIVGVVGDVRGQLDKKAPAEYYVTYHQVTINTVSLVVRAKAGDPLALTASLRGVVQGLDKDVPLYQVRTMESRLADSVARQRFSMTLLASFAGLALALAAVGIFSVMSFLVAQRTQEIGIRMALGAQTRDVLRLVLTNGMKPALLGVAIGLVGAFAVTRFMRSLLFGVAPTDVATFVAVSACLFVIALIACYIPARRATKVDPLVALRYE